MEDSDIIGDDGYPVQEYTISFFKTYLSYNLIKQNKENENNDGKIMKFGKIYEDFM